MSPQSPATAKPADKKKGLRSAKHGSGGRQNTSDAVMAQRGLDDDALDDFPTPPWATRAFIEKVIPINEGETCVEPAAGRGYMSEVLKEKFARVDSFDIGEYNGYCPALEGGFLENDRFSSEGEWDWCITNPPFKLAEEFIRKGLHVARRGVAMLCRTVIIEGGGRFERLYNVTPPSLIAQYVERVPMVEAQFDPKASTATGYCWIVWDKECPAPVIGEYNNSLLQVPLCWIPSCRKELERPYERINALLIVSLNEAKKADDIALGTREGTDEDVENHREKAADRRATAIKELAALKSTPDWNVTKKLLRDFDGSRMTQARIASLIGEL